MTLSAQCYPDDFYHSYSSCFFLVRFDPEGRIIWAEGAAGPSGFDVAITDEGYVMVTGGYTGRVDESTGMVLGPTLGRGENSVTLPASGYHEDPWGWGEPVFFSDVFLARYHADSGVLDWVVHTESDWGDDYGVAVDDWGYTAVVGAYERPELVFVDTGGNTVTIPEAGRYGLFVATYGPDGRLLWANGWGGWSLWPADVVVDAGGHTLLVGVEGLDDLVLLARYGPMGVLHWTTPKELTGVQGARVAADAGGNALVALEYNSDPMYGSNQFSLSRYRTDGTLDWEVSAGAAESLSILELEVAPDGDAVVIGRSRGVLTFGSGNDSVTFYTQTGDPFFVARYSSNGLFESAVQLEGTGGLRWQADAALRP